ncbi:MAG TPA: FAD-dependent oxidoreductase [Sphingobacterium bovisgrunnientis]|nr:FAD-dependent oxidoreductase [Sphingobacterium bovisgrunnientis]
MSNISILRKMVKYAIAILILFYSCEKEPRIKEVPDPIVDFWGIDTSSKNNLSTKFDVVVYGGTPAGIMAAIEAKRTGHKVLLINSTEGYLGGMLTNGLGNTDVIHPTILGGLSREFFARVKNYYNENSNWFIANVPKYGYNSSVPDLMFKFEPRAAQTVFRDMLIENQLDILHNDRLRWDGGVIMDVDRNIQSIIMESGKKIIGKVFIDASYEGDLMAKAGVSYIVGRESNADFNEKYNGIRRVSSDNRNQFPTGINLFGNSLVNPALEAFGSGDSKIQAYCYRMCLTDIEQNKVEFSKPLNYEEADYVLLLEYLKLYRNIPFFDLSMMPNRKTDSNNSGPFSTDFVGGNYEYPEADYNLREEIRQKHKTYQQGLMWTLANHPNVPENIRNETRRWGLAKDEFVENGHWPYQLYIREARRMRGSYTITEFDCSGSLKTEYSIALGDYPMDSHIVQRYLDRYGYVQNEGQTMAAVSAPYGIDYRALLPKESECKNLIVPVCLSATHIAYGSLRMEPIFMTLGQVSACIASLAIQQDVSLQKVDYEDIKPVLKTRRMVF